MTNSTIDSSIIQFSSSSNALTTAKRNSICDLAWESNYTLFPSYDRYNFIKRMLLNRERVIITDDLLSDALSACPKQEAPKKEFPYYLIILGVFFIFILIAYYNRDKANFLHIFDKIYRKLNNSSS